MGFDLKARAVSLYEGCCFAYSIFFIVFSSLSKSNFFLTVANEPLHFKGRKCKLEILFNMGEVKRTEMTGTHAFQ